MSSNAPAAAKTASLYFPSACFYAAAMRTAPRKVAAEDHLYTLAVNALVRRSYSVHEMSVYLKRRAQDESAVPRLLARLQDHKYLDDSRYARQFVRVRSELRRQGRFRIARELRSRGVPEPAIEMALQERALEADDGAIVRARLERRLKTLRLPLDERRIASLYRSLLRAGFSSETIRRELRSITRQDVPELAEANPE